MNERPATERTRMARRLVRLAATGACLGAGLLVSGPVAAQTDVEELGRVLGGARPPASYYETLQRDPTAFQFSPENGWIRRGKEVARRRNVYRAQAAAAGVSAAPLAYFDPGGVYGGDLRVPVFLVMYANTDSMALRSAVPRQALADRLYGTTPAPPYSIHSYYRELSKNRLLVTGTVFDWKGLSGTESRYEGGCNGLCGSADIAGMIREVVQAHDDSIDYGLFDNDGPDGIPNSGDDDGFVDAIVLMHPEVDGACKNVNSAAENNVWAHRWSYRGRTGTTLATGDSSRSLSGPRTIQINDYIIQGGQGGDGGCAGGQPQAMGVVAHETGHIFGLPDLYDTGGGTAGIGHWGLMGSGNWNKPHRPAHMEAWSRARLGWVSEVIVAADTTLRITPVQMSDTAYVVPISGSNEYFLVENRQPLGSDSALHGAGLLVWHVDSVLMRIRGNSVNASMPHALALEQADGRNDMLGAPAHRGDDGDPYPGSSVNREFGPRSTPSSARNDGTPTYISVDSIDQLGDQSMVARIRFRRPTVVQATDTMAVFRFNGAPYRVLIDLLDEGTQHALDIDSVQTVDAGRRRYTFVSWSNGQQRSHVFTASSIGDSIVATVQAEFRLAVTRDGTGTGTVTADPTLDVAAGAFVSAGTPVTLVAETTGVGHLFEGWSGDTTSQNDTLRLAMGRPFVLRATFAAPLAVSGPPPPQAVMGAPYQHQFVAAGGVDARSWSVVGGTLPQGLSFAPGGTVVGRPAQTGTFPLTLQVASGSQTATAAVQLEVVAPVLAAPQVVSHVVGTARPLTADQISYLDLLGNRNGQLDVGDFLAWVNATGQAVSPELAAQLPTPGGKQP